VGQLTGLLAGLAALGGLALASRLGGLERRYGLDRMIGWHRYTGMVAVFALLVHVVALLTAYSLRSGRNPVSQMISLAGQPWMPTALVGGALMLLVALTSWRRIKVRMSYETWYYLHLLGYLSVALAVGHVLTMGSDFVGNVWAQAWWIGLYVAVGLMFVLGRALPLLRSLARPLRVTAVERLGDGAISIWVGGRAVHSMHASAGQFFSLRFGVPGLWWQSHPYSLSHQPLTDGLRFTFHARGDDAEAFARIRPGTRVWLQGPYGTMGAHVARHTKVAMIAGGSGIAPLRAILDDLALRHAPVVILRVSARNQAWFVHELEYLLAQRGGRLHLIAGRRDSLLVDPFASDALLAMVPDIADRSVFVCGPTAMSRAASRGLRASGVPAQRIHTERYEY
jgi:predicted ferric reductase